MLGSLQNLCVMDIVLRDGRGRLTWAVSEFVVCVPNDKAKVSYDYDDQGRIIQYKGAYRELALSLDKVRDLDILVYMYGVYSFMFRQSECLINGFSLSYICF